MIASSSTWAAGSKPFLLLPPSGLLLLLLVLVEVGMVLPLLLLCSAAGPTVWMLTHALSVMGVRGKWRDSRAPKGASTCRASAGWCRQQALSGSHTAPELQWLQVLCCSISGGHAGLGGGPCLLTPKASNHSVVQPTWDYYLDYVVLGVYCKVLKQLASSTRCKAGHA